MTNLQSGSAVGDYRLLFPLKQTDWSEVWAARRTDGGRTVALKLLRGTSAEDPAVASLDEARAASALHHESLVETFDLKAEDGSVFVTSELIEGPSLATLMQRLAREGRPLSAAVAAHVGIRVAAALEFAGSSASIDGLSIQIVHRHICPHNVLIDAKGRVCLSDLGIVASDLAETPSGTVRGKLNYMAPEQLTGGRVTPQTDVFALGVVLYECSSGHSLFGRDNASQTINAVLNQAPRPLTELVTGYPDALWQVIHKALEKNPEDRYANPGALHQALQQVAGLVPGFAFAQDALGQFVSSLFPSDSFTAKTPVPESLESGGTGDLIGDAASDRKRRNSLSAPKRWPTVTDTDPLSALSMAGQARPNSMPPRRSSIAGGAPSRTTSGLGSAGISTASSPPPPLGIVTSSGFELQDPYLSNFEPLLSDSRTPKYAASAAAAAVGLWILVALFSGDPDAKLSKLVEAEDYEGAEAFYLEHVGEFDEPKAAFELAFKARESTGGTPSAAPSPEPEANPPADDEEPDDELAAGDDDEAAATDDGDAAPPSEPREPAEVQRASPPPPLDPLPLQPPGNLPGAKNKSVAKYARRGMKKLDAGKLSSAAADFQRCLKAGESALCHRQLGVIYFEQDNRKSAVRHFERYLELVPKAEDAALVRAHVRRALSIR